jgi:hypothetical protein
MLYDMIRVLNSEPDADGCSRRFWISRSRASMPSAG